MRGPFRTVVITSPRVSSGGAWPSTKTGTSASSGVKAGWETELPKSSGVKATWEMELPNRGGGVVCGEVRKGLEKPEGVPAKKVVAEAGGGVGRGRNGLNLSDSGGGGGGGGTPGENGCGGGGLNDVGELEEPKDPDNDDEEDDDVENEDDGGIRLFDMKPKSELDGFETGTGLKTMLLDGGGGGLLNVTGLLENDEDCGKFSEKDEGPNDEGNEEGEGIGFVNVVVGLG